MLPMTTPPVVPGFSPMIFGAIATEWNLRQTTLMSTLLAAQTERTASEKALAESEMLNTTAEAELTSIIGIARSARHKGGATGSVSLTVLNTAGAAADDKDLEHRLAQARFEQAEEAVQAAEKALRAFERELAQQYPVVTTTPVAAVTPPPPPPGPADPLALLKEAADLLEDGKNQDSNDKFDEFVAAGGVFPAGLKAKFEQAYAFGPRWGNKKKAYDAVLAWRALNP